MLRSHSLLTTVATMLGLAAHHGPAVVNAVDLSDASASIQYNVFNHQATASTMSYVNNSGICETTPGVGQHSGYFSVGEDMHMWFWFFEARNNPSDAPLALWLNGGPGCSSMIGLFQEHGPCQFYDGSDEPSVNPYSWNEYANMIYVDQPIGTGFSYGDDEATSTVTAAPYVWKLLQAFYDAFPQYEKREFGLFTESYGGHYGPEFSSFFQEQNAKVAAGEIEGSKIDLIALGVNNGWFDAKVQHKAYADYAYNNTYKQLVSESDYEYLLDAYYDRCLPAMEKCPDTTGDNAACNRASNICYNAVEGPVERSNDFNVYDVRKPSNAVDPPETYVKYLARPDVIRAIGAKSEYKECANQKISSTGDGARPFLDEISEVVQSGVTTLLWAGDADWICNWMGGLDVANLVTYAEEDAFRSAATKDYTVDGTKYGEFKTAGKLSWLKVHEAGHEVPYYQPEVSLQAFKQTMQKKAISST